MNAFNFFIKKLSTEQKVDFKTAVQAYRTLSKEEKDVYIEMSRKAKVQYKHDLAKYLFSLPPDEQAAYLNKLEAPKRPRVKREKVVTTKNGDDVDVDDIDDDEEINLQSTGDFEDTIVSGQIEVIATQDSADFDEAAKKSDNPIEEIDVTTIKMEPISSTDDLLSPNTAGTASKTPSKSSEKAAKASGSKSADKSRQDVDESRKGSSTQNDSTNHTPRKSSASKSTAPVTDDDATGNASAEKRKDKSQKRKRREEETEDIVDFENKKIKQEMEEPSRVPS